MSQHAFNNLLNRIDDHLCIMAECGADEATLDAHRAQINDALCAELNVSLLPAAEGM